MKKIITFIICLAIPLTVGGISGFATVTGLNSWYNTLNKPSFNPPNWLFGPVWTFLYILMGIGLYLIWQSPKNQERKNALIIFGLQLFLNFCWSFIFFYLENPGLAVLELTGLWVTIWMMIFYFRKVNKTASFIQVPYLLWVTFAGILNASILWLN